MTIQIRMEGGIEVHPHAQSLRHAIYSKAKNYAGLISWTVRIRATTAGSREDVESPQMWSVQPDTETKVLDVAIAADGVDDAMSRPDRLARRICKTIDRVQNPHDLDGEEPL